MTRIEHIGDCQLILGDCREVLPTLTQLDAIVTDPPYGIGADKAASKNNGKWGWTFYGETDWDGARPAKEVFDLIRSSAKQSIIWGGNYFTDFLPPSMQWLIWDKGQRDFSLADFEMAWGSNNRASRIINYPRSRALQDGKEHPTQKPVEVMEWCILQLEGKPKLICDPFMGVASTGVASVKLGRKFIGVEVHEPYFDISCRRIEKAYKQPDFFVERPLEPTQEAMW